MNEFPSWAKLVIALFVALFAVLLVNPFEQISAGRRGVVLNWGAVSDTILSEGIHFVTPFAQGVEEVDVTNQKEEVEASAASKDLQTVTAKIALNYNLDPDKVNLIYQTVRHDYSSRLIAPAIQEAVKAATAQFTAEELITKRATVKDVMRAALTERLKRDNIIVSDVSIVDFGFSASFNDAIEAKVTAEQSALAQKNKLEQVKYEAQQQIETARAEAESIRIQAQAVTQQGGKDYVQLKAIEKWNGNLPTQMIPGATVPFINL